MQKSINKILHILIYLSLLIVFIYGCTNQINDELNLINDFSNNQTSNSESSNILTPNETPITNDKYINLNTNMFYGERVDSFSDNFNVKVIPFFNSNEKSLFIPAFDNYIWNFLFKEIISDTLSGKVSDVLRISNAFLPFFVKNNIIMSLEYYIINENIYTSIYEDKIYGLFNESNRNWLYVMFYNKLILDNIGLQSPMDLWKVNAWTWDTWLEMMRAVVLNSNNINQYAFGVRGASEIQDSYPFLTSNGVDFAKIDENGKFVISIDDRFITAVNFYLEAEKNDGVIFNYFRNEHSDDKEFIYAITDIYNGKIFMLYEELRKRAIYNSQQFVAETEYTGIICAPRGPDLNHNVSSRDYGDRVTFAVSINCEHPDAAVEFLVWILTDRQQNNDNMYILIENTFNKSTELYLHSIEWLMNSVNIKANNYDIAFSMMMDLKLHEKNYPRYKTPEEIVDHLDVYQRILDTYLNIW